MAFHPFRTFQRNQKGCMAGATLLAIISFLFLGVIIQLIGGRGPDAQKSTIAESRRFGKVTNYDLYHLQENHASLKRFLEVLLINLSRDLAEDRTFEEVGYILYPLRAFINEISQFQNPEQLVNVWLVTQYAKDEGLSPDWEDAKNLLKQLTNNALTESIYTDTLDAVGFTHKQVEQLLTRHLLWEQSFERFSLSVNAVSPATRWDWYQRLFRQITVEAAAVSVDSLIDQVGEPSNSQLNALFEKYQTRRYDPTSMESGFIMPTELAFQYVIAEPTQELLDSITEEEMLAYYEENKNPFFLKPTAPLPQLPSMMPGGVQFPTLPIGDGSREPATVSPKADVSGDDEATPQTEKTDEPLIEKTDEPRTPESEEEEPETSAVSEITTRFVSYQTEEETGNEVGATPQTEETDEPQTPESEEEEPADVSILFLPFDEVKEQIRKELALEKAMAGLPIIQKKMKEYSVVYHEHFEQGKQPPQMPDLTGLAAEQGLKLVTVPMGDVYAALRTDLARGMQERQHLVQMFRRVPLPFEGEIFFASDASSVLYWVTDQKHEKRPEKLDEVKEMVLKRWKEIEARDLALKKAEGLANEAKASGQSLAEFFTAHRDMPVVETEPFSWKIYYPQVGLISGEVREKGVVAGNAVVDNQVIIAPGSDFMETVYSLQIGEIGVVFNLPRNRAYIVRITSSSPSDEALWERFQVFGTLPGMENMYLGAGRPELMSAAYEAWLEEIRSKTGFRWVNKPDTHEVEMYDDGY